MFDLLLKLHPLAQVLAAFIGILALWLGAKRIAMRMGKKISFAWKQHVFLGRIALLLWTAGALGFYIAHSVLGRPHIVGLHAQLAGLILTLSLFGLGSGFYMNKYKKNRTVLPIIHGSSNIILLALVLAECWVGHQLLGTIVLL